MTTTAAGFEFGWPLSSSLFALCVYDAECENILATKEDIAHLGRDPGVGILA